MSFEDDSPIVRFLAAVVVVTVALMPGSTGATKPTPLPPGPARFEAGAAVESVTPPPHGSVVGDPSDCSTQASFSGLRRFHVSRSRIATISRPGTSPPVMRTSIATATDGGMASCSVAEPTRHASHRS